MQRLPSVVIRGLACAGFLQDGRDLRIGHKALPALFVPIEERPYAVLFGRIAEDGAAGLISTARTLWLASFTEFLS